MFLLRIGRFLIYSNLYVALPIAALVLLTYSQFGIAPNYTVVLFSYLATLFLYNFHRLVGYRTTKSRFTNRMLWIHENLSTIYWLLALSGIGLAITLYQIVTLKFMVLLAIITFISFGYSIPVVPTNNKLKRLRDFGMLKPLFISSVVSIVSVGFPLLIADFDFYDLKFKSVIAQRFFFILAITIPFDIRDISVDQQDGVATIPILIGERGSKLLALFFLLCSVVGIGIYDWTEIYPVITICLIAAVVVWFSNEKRTSFYFAYLVEGTMILFYLIFILFEASRNV